jgi:hypothetical protein
MLAIIRRPARPFASPRARARAQGRRSSPPARARAPTNARQPARLPECIKIREDSVYCYCLSCRPPRCSQQVHCSQQAHCLGLLFVDLSDFSKKQNKKTCAFSAGFRSRNVDREGGNLFVGRVGGPGAKIDDLSKNIASERKPDKNILCCACVAC